MLWRTPRGVQDGDARLPRRYSTPGGHPYLASRRWPHKMPGSGQKLTVCHPSVFSPGPGPAVIGDPHHRQSLVSLIIEDLSTADRGLYDCGPTGSTRPCNGLFDSQKGTVPVPVDKNGQDQGHRVTKGGTGSYCTPPPTLPKSQWGRQYPTIPKIQWGQQYPTVPKIRWGRQYPILPKVQRGRQYPTIGEIRMGLSFPAIPKIRMGLS